MNHLTVKIGFSAKLFSSHNILHMYVRYIKNKVLQGNNGYIVHMFLYRLTKYAFSGLICRFDKTIHEQLCAYTEMTCLTLPYNEVKYQP